MVQHTSKSCTTYEEAVNSGFAVEDRSTMEEDGRDYFSRIPGNFRTAAATGRPQTVGK